MRRIFVQFWEVAMISVWEKILYCGGWMMPAFVFAGIVYFVVPGGAEAMRAEFAPQAACQRVSAIQAPTACADSRE